MKDLNQLRDRAFKCASSHGFHDEEFPVGHWLMLVITELSEMIEADRLGLRTEKKRYIELVKDTDAFSYGFFTYYIKDTFEDEMADVVIRLLDLAGLKNIDLSSVSELITDEYKEKYSKIKHASLPHKSFDMVRLFTYDTDNIATTVTYAIAAMFLMAHEYEVDLWWHIEMKMAFNEHRPVKNGKRY